MNIETYDDLSKVSIGEVVTFEKTDGVHVVGVLTEIDAGAKTALMSAPGGTHAVTFSVPKPEPEEVKLEPEEVRP